MTIVALLKAIQKVVAKPRNKTLDSFFVVSQHQSVEGKQTV